MAEFNIKPQVNVSPPNFGIGDTYSWIRVDGAERQLYARAAYITNLSDLVVTLSATDVRIGGVEIVDNDSGLRCDVTSFDYADGTFNALRVNTQDLEPFYDGVAIGDQDGNMVSVTPSTSSLNVNVTNFDNLSSVINQERIITLLDALTAREYEFSLNVQDIDLNTDNVESLLTATNTFLNTISANSIYGTIPLQPLYVAGDLSATITNPITAVEITNTVLNVGVANCRDWSTIPVVATSIVFTPLQTFPCSLVTIYNSSSDTINIKRTGNSYAIPLKKNCSIDINVISDANEISVSSSTIELTASALVTKF